MHIICKSTSYRCPFQYFEARADVKYYLPSSLERLKWSCNLQMWRPPPKTAAVYTTATCQLSIITADFDLHLFMLGWIIIQRTTCNSPNVLLLWLMHPSHVGQHKIIWLSSSFSLQGIVQASLPSALASFVSCSLSVFACMIIAVIPRDSIVIRLFNNA